MLYQGDIGLYLSGSPVPVPSCLIYIEQPTIKQIEQFGETKFLMATQLLGEPSKFLFEIREGNIELKELSDFQIILIMVQEQVQTRECFDIFFELVCPQYEVEYTKNEIKFFVLEEDKKVLKGQITPFTFEFFQIVVKELFIIHTSEGDDYNPANEEAQKIYEKLRKGREKVQQQKNGGQITQSGNSLFGLYASILSIGLQMDINIFFNYTPFQLCDAFNRYWLKVQSDFYTKVSTTPMMDTSKMEKPPEWTANLYGVNN